MANVKSHPNGHGPLPAPDLVTRSIPGANKTLQTIQFYVKLTILCLYIALTALLFLPIVMIRPKHHWNMRIYAISILPMMRLLGFCHEIRDIENLVKHDEGAIILSNHQLFFDFMALAMYSVYTDRMTLIAKKSTMYLLHFGLLTYLLGLVFVDREKPEAARAEINKNVLRIKDNKLRVIVFPEGTRNQSDNLSRFLPFKKGGFHLAIDAQLPIVPVVYSPYTFLDFKQKIFTRGTVTLKVLPAVPTKGLTKDDIPLLIEKVRGQMEDTYRQLATEKFPDVNGKQTENGGIKHNGNLVSHYLNGKTENGMKKGKQMENGMINNGNHATPLNGKKTENGIKNNGNLAALSNGKSTENGMINGNHFSLMNGKQTENGMIKNGNHAAPLILNGPGNNFAPLQL